MRRAKLVLLFALLSINPLVFGQAGNPAEQPVSEADLRRLPAPYREEARKLRVNPADLAIFDTDDSFAGEIISLMAASESGGQFLKNQLGNESSPTRRALIILCMETWFGAHPSEQSRLEDLVASDPDPTVVVAAAETLRSLRVGIVRKLLEDRLNKEKVSDTAAKLRDEYQSGWDWYAQVRLPKFAGNPVPAFTATPTTQRSIRAVAFGDFGWEGGDGQLKTAKAIRAYHQKHPFDFGITLGDNFYGNGPLFPFSWHGGIGQGSLSSPDSPRWKTQWEDTYSPLGIKFYVSIGNDDYDDPDGLPAELAYTARSHSWVFPSPYYTYTAGPTQFFALDVVRLTDKELEWLDTELGKSTARWKVVYGHYHIYPDNKEMIDRLLPVLKKRGVDVYMCGHVHELRELEPDGNLHFYISGGGGIPVGGWVMEPGPKDKFAKSTHGFAVIEANERQFNVIFVNDQGQEIERSHINK